MAKGNDKAEITFASYAETNEGLANMLVMAESIREFGGRFRFASIMIIQSEKFKNPNRSVMSALDRLGVKFRRSSVPDIAGWFYFSGKTYAAGLAESELEDNTDVLVWMDEDTVILQEPSGLYLDEDISFAYRPVMHNRSGSLYSEPPDDFWARIYRLLEIDQTRLFPMVTPADRQTIRAYFNAGLLAVRPREGILRNWVRSFEVLYRDPVLAGMCGEEVDKRIFLHQTALVGTVNSIEPEKMKELPETYNYPLFFHRQYSAIDEFDSIEDIVTLRYDTYFRNPDPDWRDRIKGQPRQVAWLKEKLGKTGNK